MIRFLWVIAIGSLTVSTINLFSNVNDYEEQKQSRDGSRKTYNLPQMLFNKVTHLQSAPSI